jgi:hypothetical protein
LAGDTLSHLRGSARAGVDESGGADAAVRRSNEECGAPCISGDIARAVGGGSDVRSAGELTDATGAVCGCIAVLMPSGVSVVAAAAAVAADADATPVPS